MRRIVSPLFIVVSAMICLFSGISQAEESGTSTTAPSAPTMSMNELRGLIYKNDPGNFSMADVYFDGAPVVKKLELSPTLLAKLRAVENQVCSNDSETIRKVCHEQKVAAYNSLMFYQEGKSKPMFYYGSNPFQSVVKENLGPCVVANLKIFKSAYEKFAIERHMNASQADAFAQSITSQHPLDFRIVDLQGLDMKQLASVRRQRVIAPDFAALPSSDPEASELYQWADRGVADVNLSIPLSGTTLESGDPSFGMSFNVVMGLQGNCSLASPTRILKVLQDSYGKVPVTESNPTASANAQKGTQINIQNAPSSSGVSSAK